MRQRKLARAAWLSLVRLAAKPYLIGPELADAIEACSRLHGNGLGCTLSYWNRDTEAPRQVADAYLEALDALLSLGADSYLSLKAPALGFDPALLAEIVEKARPARFRLHLDSLAPEAAEPTLDLIARAAGSYSPIGCTLPARWKRSAGDADRAAELGLLVRVVKGQWPDPGGDLDMRAGFLSIIDRLSGRAPHVGVATHDLPLAREALRRLIAAGTSCELELLYGLPIRSALRLGRELDVPIRLYVPYGHAWLPYALSQARRNPRVFWWLMRDLARAGFSARSL